MRAIRLLLSWRLAMLVALCISLSVTQNGSAEATPDATPPVETEGRVPAVAPTSESSIAVTASATPGTTSSALAKQHFVTLHRTLELDFRPARALFFVRTASKALIVYPGTIVLLPNSEKLLATHTSVTVGTSLAIDSAVEEMRYSLLLIGAESRFHLDQEQTLKITSDGIERTSVDGLRAHLLQRKEALRSWQVQVSAQEESLLRLQEDASVIGNLGRIVEVKDEVERTKSTIRNLERDVESMKELLNLARTRALPKNYPLREGELTRQIVLLAEAAKSAEAQERLRRVGGESDLQKKLTMIERTRGDDPDRLQRELVRLRRERLQLERLRGARGE